MRMSDQHNEESGKVDMEHFRREIVALRNNGVNRMMSTREGKRRVARHLGEIGLVVQQFESQIRSYEQVCCLLYIIRV